MTYLRSTFLAVSLMLAVRLRPGPRTTYRRFGSTISLFPFNGTASRS